MARRAVAGGAALFAVSLFALGPSPGVTATERDPQPAPSAPLWRSSPLAASAPVADCDSLVVPRDAENNTLDDPEHGVMLLESSDATTGAELRVLIPYSDPGCRPNPDVQRIIDHVVPLSNAQRDASCEASKRDLREGAREVRGVPVYPEKLRGYIERNC